MRKSDFVKGYNLKKGVGVDGLDDVIDFQSW